MAPLGVEPHVLQQAGSTQSDKIQYQLAQGWQGSRRTYKQRIITTSRTTTTTITTAATTTTVASITTTVSTTSTSTTPTSTATTTTATTATTNGIKWFLKE